MLEENSGSPGFLPQTGSNLSGVSEQQVVVYRFLMIIEHSVGVCARQNLLNYPTVHSPNSGVVISESKKGKPKPKEHRYLQ